VAATRKLTIPTLVESKSASLTTGARPVGIFDVSSRLHRNLGFEWRPIQKSSLLNTLCKNLKSCRTFVKQAIKANLVSLEDLVTLFYDHVPAPGVNENGSQTTFTPHWTALIDPRVGDVYLQTPSSVEEFTRQSLTGLLDICEAIECKTVYASVKKGTEDMKSIMRAFMCAGFQVVPPSIKQMDGYVFLAYEL